METGKPGLASAPVHISSVAAQTEKRMDMQAPLTAVYIHTVPALPAQPYPQFHAAAQEPATLQLATPLYSKEALSFVTVHISGGLQSPPGLSLAAAAPTAKPKSVGKHVCPHCGRDCLKPSVLEKHLRCHTGERPYPCTTCGVSFKTQSNLYKHKRTQAHARLSSESEQSSLGSLDSVSSFRETHASSLSLDEHSEDSGSMEKDATPIPAEITCPANTAKVHTVKTQGSVSEQKELTPADHKTEPNESAKVKTPLNVRHLPLQRQEATLFSKQWESSVSRGKSQSHESTDSGFSESSDHFPSPGSVLPDHSMDSLTESNKEHLEEATSTHAPSETGQSVQEPKGAREQEQKMLEERISKLISENTAVVEDKQLENVRPRKTVLSKQGSIDLPMPYTYKDSFHFDMRISKTPNFGSQRHRKPGLYSSVPTQGSTTLEHAPLTRSNSLPFSVALLQPERSSPTSSYQSDYAIIRRGSSGQINPTGFVIKPVNQQSSTHRPLVRQTAVDCNHATDGLFMNSSVEEASTSSLSCDGDDSEICGEPSNRKFRRKKAQKFAYNKWYMYGGGTFKKLYKAEKSVDNSVIKGRKSMNPQPEVVQGSPKMSSATQKETLTTPASTINISSSSATVCLPDCPLAKMPIVSTVDFNPGTSLVHSSYTSLKTPLRRNLSSILPLPSTALVCHKTGSLSSSDAGRLSNEGKHTDTTSQICGAHVPSDRKKQRTDEKIICSLKVESDTNTLTHPPPSVTGSTPQQDTNIIYINIQKNRKHTHFKGAPFLPCILNANAPSVSALPATSIPSAAKTSFLPKYQLKLPNAAEADSSTSLDVVDKPTGTDGCTFTSALSSSQTEQMLNCPFTTSEKKVSDPVTSLTCDIKKTNDFSPSQAQLLLSCSNTTFCRAEISRSVENVTSSVVQRQLATTTVTTTCRHMYQAGSCSNPIQPLKSAAVSVPMQLPRPVAPVVANFPARPTITTARNQTSASAITAFPVTGQLNSSPPLSHSQLLPSSSDQLNPVNRVYTNPNTPNVPCHIMPFDQVQPAADNVFHVQTADLQICLQIISDEQLALIEPQIERQAGSSVLQRCNTEALAPEVIQNKAQGSVTMESCSEGRDHQQTGHQKESDPSGSLAALNMETIKLPLSVHFGNEQPNIQLAEHSNSSQATVSAESKPPEAPGLTLRPHKYSHVNTTTEALSSVMSTTASLEGVQLERSQTSEEEHALSLNHCAQEQLLLDRRVSQGTLVLQTLSGQHKLSVTCASPNTVHQNTTRSELLSKESQQKLKNQEAGIIKAKGEASAHKNSRLESGETHPPLQVKFRMACGGECADELSGSLSPFSTNKCDARRQFNPQASICRSQPSEPTSSDTLNTSKHENRGCDRDNPDPLQKMTLSGSQDVISSTHSEKQLDQCTTNIQVERSKDIPGVLTNTAGPTVGASLMGCATQKEPQTWGHSGGAPGQSDSTDCMSRQRQEAGVTNHQRMDRQGGEVTIKDNNGGPKTDQVPGQWSNAESNPRYKALPDVTKPEREDKEVKADFLKNSWPSEQHLQHLSQMHPGMSTRPPQSPQQAPSMSDNVSSQVNLFNPPQPPLEINNLYFSQQHWESSIIHNQQNQFLSQSNSSQFMKTQAQLTETQNSSSKTQSTAQQTTFSHQEQKQDQKQTLCTQEGNITGGNSSTGVSCAKLTPGSPKRPSLSHVKTSPSTHHCHVSRTTAGSTGITQVLNHKMLVHNTGLPSKPFTYPEPEQDSKDQAPNDYTMPSSNTGRADIANRYQSFYLTGQLHGFQPAECLTGEVRPVQSCQDLSEDTSSSDDEGKLIIEL